jgi:hypothetical protein
VVVAAERAQQPVMLPTRLIPQPKPDAAAAAAAVVVAVAARP